MAELQAAIDDASRHLKGTDNDSKVSVLQALERALNSCSGQDVDGPALETITSLIKLSLRNGNSHVYTAGVSCSSALFRTTNEAWHSLKESNSHSTAHLDIVVRNAVHTLAFPPGGLITFLGDAKDSVRAAARAALLHAAKLSAAISASDTRLQPDQQPLALLDKLIKEQGFGSKNAKTREQSILYITEFRAACPTLPLRAWVSTLVNALEDSDPLVRDVARESVITIFTAPTVGPAAKADLKKELVKNGVRKTTSDTILRRTLGSGLPSSSSSMTGSPPSIHGSLASDTASGGRRTPSLSMRPPARPSSSMGRSPSSSSLPRSSTGTSTDSFKPSRGDRLLKEPKNKTHEELLADLEAVAAANAPPPSAGEANVVKVVYIASVRDLEQEFEAMQPSFAGKETEFNWQDREKAIFRIRGMLRGSVHQTYRSGFVACLKTAVECILKAINSLRTTLAAAGCQLIGELGSNLKDALLPLFEPFFGGCLKLASLTKKAIAQAAQDSASILLRECAYHHKSLSIIAALLDQKNTAARIYAAQHFKTLLDAQGKKHKASIETSAQGGLPLLSQMLKKELADANASVREIGRATFWLVYDIWPDLGQTILESIDSTARKALEKANNRGIRLVTSHTQASGLAQAKKSAAGRPSMRELINSRRAAQTATTSALHANELSASTLTPAKPDSGSEKESAVDNSLSRGHDAHQVSPPSPAEPVTRPSLSHDAATTPKKRPSSMYGNSSFSHIPSPPRGNQHSPRSRTFSGDAGQRRMPSQPYDSLSHQSNGHSPLGGDRTPTQPFLPTNKQPEASLMSRDSSRSSSPPLRAPALDNEVSDIEASTFNAMPDGLDSTDDESVNLLNYTATALRQGGDDTAAFDTSERSRILDGLMDTTFQLSENVEVEEAVKGLADQAEQTAHRFLELTEIDNDVTARDQTILDQSHATVQNSYASDIPVPYTPLSGALQERRQKGASLVISDGSTTPLLQKLQALHLTDSPTNSAAAQSSSAVLTTFAQDEWWISKANLSQVLPEGSGLSIIDRLKEVTQNLESSKAEERDMLELAQISRELPLSDDQDSADANHAWSDGNRYGRIIEQLCRQLHNAQGDEYTFNCLVALLNLVTHQAPLLNSRELNILEALFAVSQTLNKNIRTGAECVTLGVISATEPLYAASCIRICLDNLQIARPFSDSPPEESETRNWTFAMGLKAMGALFSLLPSEVLEEEIVRSRDLIKQALNSPQAGLRQTAATVLVKAHQVIQDDNRLFELINGLTKSQINLCTYLFARNPSSTS